MSIGTRGDMEPFLAAGELLHAAGHQVHYAFPEQFSGLVPAGRPFYPLSRAFIELLDSAEGRMIMGGGGNGLAQARALYTLYKKGLRVNGLLVQDQYRIVQAVQPDRIIHHAKCTYPVIWGLQTGRKNVLLSPVPYFLHTDERHAHVGFNFQWGKLVNRLSYRLANFGLVKTIYDSQQQVPEGKKQSRTNIRQALFDTRLAYTISPSLYDRPAHWPEHVRVCGYHERNKTLNWQPDAALEAFLQWHEGVVLLSFGSMVSADPLRLSQICYQAMDELGVPVLVNTSSGGLLRLRAYENHRRFYFVDTIPYDWIMGRVAAVIHHGGSGTTHSGLKNGRPTLIIPHIIDQFLWRDLVHARGLGPRGVSAKKLTTARLKPLVKDLLENPGYSEKVESLSRRMKEEGSREKFVRFMTGANVSS
ncbi:glycosyltransferase [Roseivirga sp. BDSF3-8]|uniref:glycosyltransferase n=1 Tax=Roseivirga sp. BDSF3-8 TaxID=3241598 RepID=UPI003531DCD3